MGGAGEGRGLVGSLEGEGLDGGVGSERRGSTCDRSVERREGLGVDSAVKAHVQFCANGKMTV